MINSLYKFYYKLFPSLYTCKNPLNNKLVKKLHTTSAKLYPLWDDPFFGMDDIEAEAAYSNHIIMTNKYYDLIHFVEQHPKKLSHADIKTFIGWKKMLEKNMKWRYQNERTQDH